MRIGEGSGAGCRMGWWALLFKVAPLPSAKRCTVAKHPAREPPLRPQQLHLCCHSNNTRRRCNRCLLPSYLTQLPPRSMQSLLCLFQLSVWTAADDDDL